MSSGSWQVQVWWRMRSGAPIPPCPGPVSAPSCTQASQQCLFFRAQKPGTGKPKAGTRPIHVAVLARLPKRWPIFSATLAKAQRPSTFPLSTHSRRRDHPAPACETCQYDDHGAWNAAQGRPGATVSEHASLLPPVACPYVKVAYYYVCTDVCTDVCMHLHLDNVSTCADATLALGGFLGKPALPPSLPATKCTDSRAHIVP